MTQLRTSSSNRGRILVRSVQLMKLIKVTLIVSLIVTVGVAIWLWQSRSGEERQPPTINSDADHNSKEAHDDWRQMHSELSPEAQVRLRKYLPQLDDNRQEVQTPRDSSGEGLPAESIEDH
ncbi:MAG: hypothetical protein AAF581_08840 [Planctomycetota bacterium]